MSAHAFDVTFAMPVAEGCGEMFELPFAVGRKVWMFRDSLQDDWAVGHCLKGCFVFEFVAVGGGLWLDSHSGIGLNCSWSHNELCLDSDQVKFRVV